MFERRVELRFHHGRVLLLDQRQETAVHELLVVFGAGGVHFIDDHGDVLWVKLCEKHYRLVRIYVCVKQVVNAVQLIVFLIQFIQQFAHALQLSTRDAHTKGSLFTSLKQGIRHLHILLQLQVVFRSLQHATQIRVPFEEHLAISTVGQTCICIVETLYQGFNMNELTLQLYP